MFIEGETLTITTLADGTKTVATVGTYTGRILAIHYIKPGTNSYTDGVDFTITNKITGETIWTQLDVNASKTVRPRGNVHTTAGVAVGTDPLQPLTLFNAQIQFVLAAGGDAKVGTFMVEVG